MVCGRCRWIGCSVAGTKSTSHRCLRLVAVGPDTQRAQSPAKPSDPLLSLDRSVERVVSADSRYIALLQRHPLIGHAHRELLSTDIKGNWAPRFERFWRGLS